MPNVVISNILNFPKVIFSKDILKILFENNFYNINLVGDKVLIRIFSFTI